MKAKRKPLNLVDLFCGCGGFSLGAHKAGLRPRLSIDIDPILTSSFKRNFPKTELSLIDLSLLDGASIVKKLGKVDGVFGGPPCQGFSAIGRRQEDDPRRGLLGHFFRIVSEISPAFFVMENVQGLGYENARPTLDAAIGLLPGRYRIIGPITLDAASFGAATRRPRLFVIGYDPDKCESFDVEDIMKRGASRATVRAAISDLVDAAPLGDSNGFDLWKIRKPGRPSKYAAKLRASDLVFTGNQQTDHSAKVRERFANVIPGETDKVGRHVRLSWDGVCPTLRAGTGRDRGSYQSVRPIHPDQARVITVREGARLQGFHDSFQFHPTQWHSFRMIGNSVSPIIAEAIMKTIKQKLT